MSERTPHYPRPLARLASKKWGRAIAKNLFTPLDKAIYRITGGRFGLSPERTVLYLTTTGRKSGKPRRVPVLYLRDGNRIWIMASNYGQERHPGWSANLMADPEAIVQIGTRTERVRARLGTDAEKTDLLPRLIELYPAWEQYASWTDRRFRLFCLEPKDEE